MYTGKMKFFKNKLIFKIKINLNIKYKLLLENVQKINKMLM